MNQRVKEQVEDEAPVVEEDEDDEQQAFQARMMQLYDLVSDWTGEPQDDGKPCETQSDGSPVIDGGEALSTIAMFLVRVSRDMGVDDRQFDEIVGEIRAVVTAEDEEEGDEEEGDEEDEEDEEGDDGDDDEDGDDDDGDLVATADDAEEETQQVPTRKGRDVA